MSHVFHRQAKTVPRVAASGVVSTLRIPRETSSSMPPEVLRFRAWGTSRFCRQFAIRLTPFRLRIRGSLRQNPRKIWRISIEMAPGGLERSTTFRADRKR